MSQRTLPRQRRRGPALATTLALIGAGLTAQAVGLSSPASAATARQVENLDRGVTSVRSGSNNFVSWRLLGTDPSTVTFNVYRSGTKLTSSPISLTNYTDNGASSSSSYTVRAVINGVEQGDSRASLTFANGYLDVPISPPGGGTTPDGVAYTYAANDASVGDLDGDGQYEIVLKWDPTNAKDNSQSGYTGNVFIDAYKLNGSRLWRLDLGRNIRAGAHYTQFQVFDYDGDGKAEIALKTADGTKDGTGVVIGSSSADYRNSSGYVLSGPEYLTMFNGQSGKAMSTVNYDPARGTVSSWGDSYGNRVDRFLAGTAYLDGARPSLIMARGYYTRAVVAAWDFRNGSLTKRWTYDSGTSNVGLYGQGNHQLSVIDADGDGKDEIIYGSAALDDNGALLWRTGQGHGDALHVGDLIPSRAGVEVFKPTEDKTHYADFMTDARTGAIIWSHASCACDNGRAVSEDIYAGSAGAESWSSGVDGLSNAASGSNIGRKPGSANNLIYWDGDAVRELSDATRIDKYGTSGDTRLLTASDVHSNNSTKSNPSLSADLFGDWREEIIWPTTSNTALRIYATPITTSLRFPTLMHDTTYRVAIAWQNTAYNQPPHTGVRIGDGVTSLPQPNVYVPGGTPPVTSTTSTTTTTTTSRPTTTTTTTTSSSGSATLLVQGSSSRCLDVWAASTTAGDPVQLYDCNGVQGQLWQFSSAGELRTNGGAMCLDAFAYGTTPGTELIIWNCEGGSNQKFSRGANNTIVNPVSGLCVDTAGGGTSNTTRAILQTCNGSTGQRWTSSTTVPTTTTTTVPVTTTTTTTTTPPVTTTTTTTTTTTSGGTTTGKCSATYTVTGSWSGGFQADVKVTAGNAAISSWSVAMTFANGQTVTQFWGANITQSGSVATATNAAWNGALGAGASTNFGFIGSQSGTNAVPTVTCS